MRHAIDNAYEREPSLESINCLIIYLFLDIFQTFLHYNILIMF